MEMGRERWGSLGWEGLGLLSVRDRENVTIMSGKFPSRSLSVCTGELG